MIRAMSIVCAVVLSGITTVTSVLLAAPIPSTQPAADQRTILILPFSAPTGQSDQWIGNAVQQDLFTDLTQGTLARVLAPAGAPPAADADAARQAAQQNAASFVIFGQVQVAGKELRLTGEILDATTSKPLANLKATGLRENLFRMEDALAGQGLAAIPHDLLSPAALQAERRYRPATQPGAYNPAAPAAGGVDAASSLDSATSTVDVYPSSTTYTYGEPYPVYEPYVPIYTYPSPFFDSFLFFGFDFDRFHHFHHHHDFDRDFDHNFNRGFAGRNFGNFNGTNAINNRLRSSVNNELRGRVNNQLRSSRIENSFSRMRTAPSTIRPFARPFASRSQRFTSPSFSRPGMTSHGMAGGGGARPAMGGHGRR